MRPERTLDMRTLTWAAAFDNYKKLCYNYYIIKIETTHTFQVNLLLKFLGEEILIFLGHIGIQLTTAALVTYKI